MSESGFFVALAHRAMTKLTHGMTILKVTCTLSKYGSFYGGDNHRRDSLTQIDLVCVDDGMKATDDDNDDNDYYDNERFTGYMFLIHEQHLFSLYHEGSYPCIRFYGICNC